jgi:hypothetical protein
VSVQEYEIVSCLGGVSIVKAVRSLVGREMENCVKSGDLNGVEIEGQIETVLMSRVHAPESESIQVRKTCCLCDALLSRMTASRP